MTTEERREYFKRPDIRGKINERRQTPKYRDKARRSWLQRTYGITLEEYEGILKEQEGKCCICRCDPKDSFRGTLAVDHCHTTGKVRGLLCRCCNQALGLFKEDLLILERAVTYLKQYKDAKKEKLEPLPM